MLDNCETVDGSRSRSDLENTDQTRGDAVDTAAADSRGDEEEDVLLVDDYNPNVEEEVEFYFMPPPVASGGRDSEAQEVR